MRSQKYLVDSIEINVYAVCVTATQKWKKKENIYFACCLSQVGINGLTGPVHFDAYGKRIGINLEILNLRSNCFKKVNYCLFSYSIILYHPEYCNLRESQSES